MKLLIRKTNQLECLMLMLFFILLFRYAVTPERTSFYLSLVAILSSFIFIASAYTFYRLFIGFKSSKNKTLNLTFKNNLTFFNFFMIAFIVVNSILFLNIGHIFIAILIFLTTSFYIIKNLIANQSLDR